MTKGELIEAIKKGRKGLKSKAKSKARAKKSAKAIPVRLVDPDFEVISVAPIQTVKKIVEDVGETREDFMEAINKLAKQVDRIAVTNLSLQAKMTDLLIRVTDMIKHMESMINLLQKASEGEGEPPEIKANIEPVTNELKKLNIQMEELKAKMGDMTEYMRKVYTRQLLGRVIEKR